MARSVPYRREVSDACNWHQDEALNSTIYILYNTGPTGFLLKEEGEQKNFKVYLGDVHNCTCNVFKKEKDLCKHLCWLLLKKFRVPRTNPLSWQLGLCEREINEVLRGLTAKENATRTVAKKQNTEQSQAATDDGGIKQRVINEEDICPICQDGFLAKKLPVTYCKFGCGNNVHIKCMKIWADHQKSNGETQLKCPLCREKFSTFELLDEEYRNNSLFKTEKQNIHHGLSCNNCNANPISGKCYKCTVCREFYLCQACFNTDFHKEHDFFFREKDTMKYRKASREHVGALPLAIANSLLSRDITEQDYDLLLQLDQQNKANSTGLSSIPEKVIKSWPSERIKDNHKLLAPGYQCRVCLRSYQVGQLVRKLPACKHKFHADCIDNWLLHSHPTCPIDGVVAWSPEMAEMAKAEKSRLKSDQVSKNTTDALNLELSTIGLMINYKKNSIQNNKNKNENGEATAVIHRNGKPPKPRAVTTNQIKNGPLLEIKGQNVSSNHSLQSRHNSISSESGLHFPSESSIRSMGIVSKKLLLPKIGSKRSDTNSNLDSSELNDRETSITNLDPSRIPMDVFNMALVGTKPYQLSRFQNTTNDAANYSCNDLIPNKLNYISNSVNGFYSNDDTSPPLLNTNEILQHDYQQYGREQQSFSNNSESHNSYINSEQNIANEQIENVSLLSKNQIYFMNDAPRNELLNENTAQRMQNTRKLGLRIHHPKTKLTNLISKPPKRINNQNNPAEISGFKLVAVPVIKADNNEGYSEIQSDFARNEPNYNSDFQD